MVNEPYKQSQPQKLTKAGILHFSVYPIDIIPGMSTRYTGCWPLGRNPLQCPRLTSWPWCRPGTHGPKVKQLGGINLIPKLPSVSGRHRGHDVDQEHVNSGIDWEIQVPVPLCKTCVSGRPSIGFSRPGTLDYESHERKNNWDLVFPVFNVAGRPSYKSVDRVHTLL